MSQGLKLAAGWNVSLGSLVDITSITPSGDEPFADPKDLGLYDNGIIKIRGDGQITTQGFAAAVWMFTRLTYKQLDYLRTTYCGNGLSGNVTVLTHLSGSATLTRMNAVLIIPKPTDLQSEFRYKDVHIRFTRLTTPS